MPAAKQPEDALAKLEQESAGLIPLAAAEQKKLATGQRALRGLFAGGTFCYEAQLILRNLPEPIYSNAPLDKDHTLGAVGAGSPGPYHTCIDLGEDEFTQGRLHPMIDPSLRNRRIIQEAHDPTTAVILLDIVLGYGAHPDPAGAAVEAIREAQQIAAEAGRHIVFVASVCGTEADPQPLSQQEAKLRGSGRHCAARQRRRGTAGRVDHAGVARVRMGEREKGERANGCRIPLTHPLTGSLTPKTDHDHELRPYLHPRPRIGAPLLLGGGATGA